MTKSSSTLTRRVTPRGNERKIQKVGQVIPAGLATGQAEQEVLYGGLDEKLTELIEFVSELESELKKLSGQAEDAGVMEQAQAQQKAQSAAKELKVKLQNRLIVVPLLLKRATTKFS